MRIYGICFPPPLDNFILIDIVCLKKCSKVRKLLHVEENNFIKNVKEKSGGGTVVGNGYADVKKIDGNTIVWNQLSRGDYYVGISGGLIYAKEGNTIVVNGTATEISYAQISTDSLITGHKYLLKGCPKNGSSSTYYLNTPSVGDDTGDGLIGVRIESQYNFIRIYVKSGVIADNLRFNVQLFDLTKMFGSGNEPTTVEEFERLFPIEYAPYCEGRLVSLGGYKIKWNQMVNTSTTSVTLTSGHKFYTKISGTASIVTGSGNTQATTGGTDMVCDLTTMFGPGSEPTLEEFESMFGTEYSPYDEGTEMNILEKMELQDDLSVKSTGFNLWDGEASITGYRFGTQGKDLVQRASGSISSYIRVKPSTSYYLKNINGEGIGNAVVLYDINKEYIVNNAISGGTGVSGIINTTKDTVFIRFQYETENADKISVNLSDPAKNGTYFPYTTSTQDLSWIYDIEYKPEGSTTSEKLFPYGLLSAGDVHDEITDTGAVKRIGVVDLGSLTWNYYSQSTYPNIFITPLSGIKQISSGVVGNLKSVLYTAAAAFGGGMANKTIRQESAANNILICDETYTDKDVFKSAMSGILLYYELAEPITITFTSPKDLGYNVQSGGTEELLPTNPSGSGPITAPVLLSVNYPLDAVGTLTNLPRNYISVSSMDSFTTALGNFLNANITRTWDAANEKYTFTVVSRT
jgi:hypothetical protein